MTWFHAAPLSVCLAALNTFIVLVWCQCALEAKYLKSWICIQRLWLKRALSERQGAENLNDWLLNQTLSTFIAILLFLLHQLTYPLSQAPRNLLFLNGPDCCTERLWAELRFSWPTAFYFVARPRRERCDTKRNEWRGCTGKYHWDFSKEKNTSKWLRFLYKEKKEKRKKAY